MFKIFKKLKELETKLSDIYDSDMYKYYAFEYNKKYNEALEKAKVEILTYKPKSYTYDNMGWEETTKIYSSVLGRHRWVCNGIWFNEKDCKTLDTLYDNRIKENLKEYPKSELTSDLPNTSGTVSWLTSNCPCDNCSKTKKNITSKKKGK